MIYHSINFFKRAILFTFLLILNLCFLNACSYGKELVNKKDLKNEPQVYLIGEQKVMSPFARDLKKVAETDKPMDEGDVLLKSGKYSEAKEKYLHSLDLLNKYKMTESFHQWVPRWKLAEVYEKLNENKNALEQIDWLIKHCQNDDTKRGLSLRRDRLLTKI